MLITPNQLTLVCPSIKGQRAINIAGYLSDICPWYGIDTSDIFHEFIANVLVECQEFTRFKENLNYSAKGLRATWKFRFPSDEIANQYAHQPQKIAEKVYGGRMGNIHPGDAWKFIGSGPIQLTGRDMITSFTIYYNRRFGTNYMAEAMAELLRTDIKVGVHSACWFFAIAKNLLTLAINDDMLKIVNRINGGYNGLEEREGFYERAKKYI